MKNMKKNIPNAITTTRLLGAIAFPILFLTGNIVPALITFGLAAASDAVDGYLARKWQVESNYGRQIDPIADKLLSGGALAISAILINPMMFIPLILESVIAVMGLQKIRSKEILPVNKTGKIKTILLFPTVGIGLLSALIPALNLALIPLVFATGALQMATIKSYYNQEIEKQKQVKRVGNDPKQSTFEEVEETNSIEKNIGSNYKLLSKNQLQIKLLKELKNDIENDTSLMNTQDNYNQTSSLEKSNIKKLTTKK